MAQVGDLFRAEIITPIDHIKTFDISKIEQAMTYFSQGTHLGKVVVTFENSTSLLPVSRHASFVCPVLITMVQIRPSIPRASFDPTANYLLVGCLGGLGRSISKWMVEHGARHLCFISRSGASSSEAASTISELKQLGVQTSNIRCSVTERGDLLAAVKKASQARAIKGVVHAAMVEGVSAAFTSIHLINRLLIHLH